MVNKISHSKQNNLKITSLPSMQFIFFLTPTIFNAIIHTQLWRTIKQNLIN